MKIIYLISSVIISASCFNWIQNQTIQDGETNPNTNNFPTKGENLDSVKWNTSFLKFVKAISDNDQKNVKSFIDFPIRNEGNEIWYLADSRLVMKIDPHKIVPFTEADFDKYYNSIFAMDFRMTLQKLNLDEFFLKGNTSSPDIVVIKGSTSKITATYDKTNHKFTLKLITSISGPHKTRFEINYQFDVLKDQDVKFRSVHVTG